jgi:hypothetical protein
MVEVLSPFFWRMTALLWLVGWTAHLNAVELPTAGADPGAIRTSKSKYPKANPEEFQSNRTRALAMAEKTRQEIVWTMHLVETPHFLIFSAWNWLNDAALANLCEAMYQKLSEQFDVPATESVWIGKCPVYLFWDPAHYARFITDVDQSRATDSNMAHANGYHATKGHFSYIVINGVSQFGATQEMAKIRFYHVLVHEGTHAFMNRYISDESMPLWLEEGLADYVAASLVPQSDANRTYISASRSALRNPESVKRLLNQTRDLTATEYGIAQSLVRTLVEQDRIAMVRFVELIKHGESDEDAMEEAYHMSRAEFVRNWMLRWQQLQHASMR